MRKIQKLQQALGRALGKISCSSLTTVAEPLSEALLELDRQASHSAQTGQSHYARTSADHQASNCVSELNFYHLSTIWQQMLGTSLHLETPISHPAIKATIRSDAAKSAKAARTSSSQDNADAGFHHERQLKAVHAAHLGADVLWREATGGP